MNSYYELKMKKGWNQTIVTKRNFFFKDLSCKGTRWQAWQLSSISKTYMVEGEIQLL